MYKSVVCSHILLFKSVTLVSNHILYPSLWCEQLSIRKHFCYSYRAVVYISGPTCYILTFMIRLGQSKQNRE